MRLLFLTVRFLERIMREDQFATHLNLTYLEIPSTKHLKTSYPWSYLVSINKYVRLFHDAVNSLDRKTTSLTTDFTLIRIKL